MIKSIFKFGLSCFCLLICFIGQSQTNAIPFFVATGKTFSNKGVYPKLYTCDSLGISPALVWTGAPAGTNSFAITMHHIAKDGEKHVYLLVYDLPKTSTQIPEAASGIGQWGMNTVNGQNNYTPPCSKGPGPKTYLITVYALSDKPKITVAKERVTMDHFLEVIKPITLASSVIEVNYSRPK